MDNVMPNKPGVTPQKEGFHEVEMIEVKPEPLEHFEEIPPLTPVESEDDGRRNPRRKLSFERCQFCFQQLQAGQRVYFDASGQLKLEKKIEFVLSTDLDASTNRNCCASCWHMFEMFYRFKKSCLIALHKQDELIMFNMPIDAIKTDIRVVSRDSKTVSPQPTEPARRDNSKETRTATSVSTIETNLQSDGAEPHPTEQRQERYPCAQCHKSFSSSNGLQAHNRKCKLLKERVFCCTLCPAVFKVPNALKWHMNIHSGAKPYGCRLENCGKKFKNPANRWEHEQNCFKNSHLRCKICKKQLRKGSSVSKHIRRHHKFESEVLFTDAEREDTVDEPDVATRPFGLSQMISATPSNQPDWRSFAEQKNPNQTE